MKIKDFHLSIDKSAKYWGKGICKSDVELIVKYIKNFANKQERERKSK